LRYAVRVKSPRHRQTHHFDAGRIIGRLGAAIAMLAMLLVAPLHAVSHIGERLPPPATTAVETGSTKVAGQPEAPGERHGTPCELCLICFNGAFSAASGSDPLPDLRIPDGLQIRHADPARVGAETTPLRHERPEVRGPPAAIA
jgi:hypothetical protein